MRSSLRVILHIGSCFLFQLRGFLYSYFFNAKGNAPALISSYISALGYVHKIRGLSDPSTAFIVRCLLRSIHKSGRKGDTRLPITEPILLELVKSLTRVTYSYYDQVMFRSMFLLAFYVFFANRGDHCKWDK